MRYLDSTWYRAMQLRGCSGDYRVDERVVTDPDGLESEIYPGWYRKAYGWLVSDRGEGYGPPTDEEVRRRLEMYEEDMAAHIVRSYPSLAGDVDHPLLFAEGLVSQRQFDVIDRTSRYWDSVYEERVAADRAREESCREAMGRRMRFLGTHDASVTVTEEADDIVMEARGGLCIPGRIEFIDASVVQGELPDRFGGLYEERYWEDGRYEIGFLAYVGGKLSEFTISAADIRLYNGAGAEITDDYDHDRFYERHSLTHHGKTRIWERDPENRTYRRVGPISMSTGSGSVRLF